MRLYYHILLEQDSEFNLGLLVFLDSRRPISREVRAKPNYQREVPPDNRVTHTSDYHYIKVLVGEVYYLEISFQK